MGFLAFCGQHIRFDTHLLFDVASVSVQRQPELRKLGITCLG